MSQPGLARGDIRKALSPDWERFYQSLEQKIIPKIGEDIETILANGWADAVSLQDLWHCHLLIPEAYPADTKGYEGLISTEDTQLLYHSREFQLDHTENRNILSSLTSEPRAVNGKRTIKDTDLKCWHLCQINFGQTEDDLNATAFGLYVFDRVVCSGKYWFGIKIIGF